MNLESKNISLKAILVVIAIGIWAIVLQNAGVIPTDQNVRVVNSVDTYVRGGNIDANIRGTVNISGDVDVNIDKVLGRPVGAHRSYTLDGREYYAIDVFRSNW